MKKVILVEDNPADVELIRLAFNNQSIKSELIHCDDGEALLKLLPQIPLNEISYILLDMNMPRINGVEVLKAFSENEEWRKLPVIVFTSSRHASDVSASYELGANAYVIKPLDFEEFDRTIRAIHEFWGDVNLKPVFFADPVY